jgi:hypothetical protein
MYWSNYGLEEYQRLLGEIGFTILETGTIGAGYQDAELSPGEAHPLIFAQRS